MRHTILKGFLVQIVLFSFLTVDAQLMYNPNEKIDKIDSLISKYALYDQFNGSVLVAHNGEIIYKKGFGMSNFELETPNTTITKHRIASMTKQFTAMLIMQLAEQKKIDLHTPISKYLPDYPKKRANQITIHHLLTHTSGTVNYTDFPNYWDLMVKQFNPSQLVELFADSALLYKPDSHIHYSNSGYALLGVIIEKMMNKPYGQALQDHIFTPLGMINSGYENSSDVLKNRASGYHWQGPELVNVRYIDMSIAFAAGGMYSTVEDLYKWDQALYTEKLVSKEYLKLLFEDHFPMYGGVYYGYGWEMEDMWIGNTTEKKRTIGHSGVINGFTSLITRFPESESSIILLNNTSQAPLSHMTRGVAGILYDLSYDMPKRSIAKLLLKTINNEGLEKGLSFFEEARKTKEHYITEGELNETGYELLKVGKANEAKAIFELILKSYPNSFNAYDSYAESLMVLGEKELAIKNYKKSLELNPKNRNATEMLKKMED